MAENEKSEYQENCVLIDWITFTTTMDSVAGVTAMLGLSSVTWEDMEHGFNGYPYGKHFCGISILYGGREDMGVCVNMSGQGCRSFETYGHGDFPSLFDLILSNEGDMKLTRLDVAYDDHTGILDMDILKDDTDAHYYLSKSRIWEVDYGSPGCTIYHGSKKSDMMIRIYDKAAERHRDGEHWIRVELQMRREIAMGFVRDLASGSLPERFAGVLLHYLRYVVPDDDSNPSRWPLTDYWSELIGHATARACWVRPGVEYNLENLENFVFNQAGNAIDTFIDIFGYEAFIARLGERATRYSPKYERLKQMYKKVT